MTNPPPLSRTVWPQGWGVGGPGHEATDTNQNRVNVNKRISELQSVPYVTARSKAGDTLLTT